MHYEILETRKKEAEGNPRGDDYSVKGLTNNIESLSVDPAYGNRSSSLYWDEFLYNEAEFPEIGKKLQRKRIEAEDRDRIDLLMTQQDEGKYMWLSPSALANPSEIYDPLDYDLITTQNCDNGKNSNVMTIHR